MSDHFTQPCPTCGAPARWMKSNLWVYTPPTPPNVLGRQSQQKLVVDEHVYNPPKTPSFLKELKKNWRKL